VLQCGPLTVPCALGRTGTKALKREGDGATPRGRFTILRVLYNAGRIRRPRTLLPLMPIAKSGGWCDAPQDRNYNRPVSLPYGASAEPLWRDDGVYDLVAVLDYNVVPRVRHAGSAIFMHVARAGFPPTEGCIALRRTDLQRLLARVRRGARVVTAA
jgi:L,D-peptidoglycan transpeptidase YkuD (ErfK/YbiS/YcfS/YnhG family)